jgi:hypothetical protein
MGVRDSLIEFMHNRAVAANAAHDDWVADYDYEADSQSRLSFASRLIKGLHWLRINLTEGLEELVTPDEQLQSLLDSRIRKNTIGADE